MAVPIAIVGYSGSESDDASDEVAEKWDVNRRSTESFHVGGPVIVNSVSTGSVESPRTGFSDVHDSASDCRSVTSLTYSDSKINTELCLESSMDDSKNVSATNDFFGLDKDSSSDSDEGIETGHFVKGGHIWTKPLSTSKRFAKNDDIEVGSKPNDESVLPHENDGPKRPLDLLPKSQFWMESSKVEDWNNPDKIWLGSKSNQKQQTMEDESESSEYPNKRQKTVEQTQQKGETRQRSSPLQKSCFYVHHKLSPALHQKETCYPPTRKYVCLKGHVGAVNRVRWSKPEFSHLIASACMDNTVKIWNIFSPTSHCVQTFYRHTKAVKDVTWSPSGKEVLSCGYDRTARLCDIVKGAEISTFEHRDFLTCVAYHPVNPNYILAGSKDRVLCWDIRCPEACMKIFDYKHSFGQVQDLVFIQDGQEFAISTDLVSRDSADRSIMVYDFKSGVVLSNQVYQERFTCTRLGVHPHQMEMMAQSSGDYIALFSTIRPYKMNRCKRFEGHKVLGYAVGCGYSPDGRFVVSGNAESRVTIWDYQRALSVKQLGDPQEIYLDVAWHPLLKSTVASSTWGGHIDIWQ